MLHHGKMKIWRTKKQNNSDTKWKIKSNLLHRQRWCGPKPCSLHGKTRGSECPAGQTCVAVRDERCFVKPCSSQGECWGPAHQAPPTARCHPESSCANVTFTFNKDVMATVSLVFCVCFHLLNFFTCSLSKIFVSLVETALSTTTSLWTLMFCYH